MRGGGGVMRRSLRIRSAVVTLVVAATLLGPFAADSVGDGSSSSAFAYATGGPMGLGYDYLGRPVAPQLLAGGQALVLTHLHPVAGLHHTDSAR